MILHMLLLRFTRKFLLDAILNLEIFSILRMGATSGIATVNTLHEEFSMLSSVALLKPSIGIDNWYMCYAMQSPYFYNTTRGDMKGWHHKNYVKYAYFTANTYTTSKRTTTDFSEHQ